MQQMTEFERIAPRLAKAHRDELAYLEHRRAEFRRGMVSMSVAAEEMRRSMQLMGQSAFEAMRKMAALDKACPPPRRPPA